LCSGRHQWKGSTRAVHARGRPSAVCRLQVSGLWTKGTTTRLFYWTGLLPRINDLYGTRKLLANNEPFVHHFGSSWRTFRLWQRLLGGWTCRSRQCGSSLPSPYAYRHFLRRTGDSVPVRRCQPLRLATGNRVHQRTKTQSSSLQSIHTHLLYTITTKLVHLLPHL